MKQEFDELMVRVQEAIEVCLEVEEAEGSAQFIGIQRVAVDVCRGCLRLQAVSLFVHWAKSGLKVYVSKAATTYGDVKTGARRWFLFTAVKHSAPDFWQKFCATVS